MEDDHRAKLRAIVLVLVGAASYGVLSTIVKLSYAEGFGTAEVTGSQVLFACAALWFCRLAGLARTGSGGSRTGDRPATSADKVKLVASGAFTGLTGGFYYYSLQWLDASIAILLLFQFTWMGLLLSWLLHRTKPSPNQWLALAVVLAGTLLASGLWAGGGSRLHLAGLGFGLLAAACYTLFMYFSGKVAVHLPTLQRTTWMVTGAAAAVSVIFPPLFLWNGALGHGLWRWGALLGFFGMVLPPFLFAKGAPRLSTGLTTILGSIELPVVLICSALLLGEPVAAEQWIGALLILAGIAVSERRPERVKTSPTQAGP